MRVCDFHEAMKLSIVRTVGFGGLLVGISLYKGPSFFVVS